MSLFVLPFGLALTASAVAVPNWGHNWRVRSLNEYFETDYDHSITLTQDEFGNLTGNGGSPKDSVSSMRTTQSNIRTYDFYIHTKTVLHTQNGFSMCDISFALR